ncbi:putative receptor-like protein kinase [Panicum miliaceum]|uniref:Receptor-like protein kinase n=1 Tax=Panicum miliaceum TaxID=4540 RepID=A0A3L6Q3B4_PANMI|nr:putative receptor-like protein kinase [Panicum miliaceum]
METFCVEEGRLLTAVLAPRHGTSTPPCDARGSVDERLGTAYDTIAVAALAAACICENPSLRPFMADVVRTLEQSAQGSIISAVGRRLGPRALHRRRQETSRYCRSPRRPIPLSYLLLRPQARNWILVGGFGLISEGADGVLEVGHGGGEV